MMIKGSIRSIELRDYDYGFIELLSQLTISQKNDMSKKEFVNYVTNIHNNPNHIVIVFEHLGDVIATGSLFITQRAIRNFGKVGHIEDVVVDKKYQSCGIGRQLITLLTNIADEKNCYKVILNCDEKNIGFYEKCGYEHKGAEMAKYLNK